MSTNTLVAVCGIALMVMLILALIAKRASTHTPSSIASNVLTTTTDIRKAIARQYQVWCFYEQGNYRISDVRTRWGGYIEVKLLSSGIWVVPDFVFVR